MRIGFSLALILLTCSISFGQLSKGNLLVGGLISFDYSTNTIDNSQSSGQSDINVLSFQFDPKVGYLFTDNLAVGLNIPIGTTRIEGDFGTNNIRDLGIGPFFRYYFPWGRFAIFPEVSYEIGRSRTKQIWSGSNLDDQEISSNYQELSAGAGFTYFVSKNVGIEGIISYQNQRSDSDNGLISDSNRNAVNLLFGVQVYLPTKKSK